jgi:hypothetical protein
MTLPQTFAGAAKLQARQQELLPAMVDDPHYLRYGPDDDPNVEDGYYQAHLATLMSA